MGQRVLQMGNFVRASGKPVRYGHCGDEPSSQQGAGELSKEPRALHFWGRQVVDQARPGRGHPSGGTQRAHPPTRSVSYWADRSEASAAPPTTLCPPAVNGNASLVGTAS